ncbi:SAP domain-containing ribonucleoprotein-like [Lepisosteus oculatus]|uniref:SAP domain-containing ribonucleoprotein-like n=1 Tax=Lepisosteus oculatus TaxID=7918 RepID=UPI0007400B9F|nr:PREDICTED: SAP domain-containing ribonucleoprotein-like [Lepisosteus oculatus]
MDVFASDWQRDDEETFDLLENASGKLMEEELDEECFEADILYSGKVSFKTFSSMTQEERIQKRSERFGETISDQAKKEARAARFGIPVHGAMKEHENLIHQEKLRKRKERFGAVMDTTILLDDQAKKRMRAERFGLQFNKY